MGSIIHARKQPDGSFVYRLWNTTCDSYETEELEEDHLRLQLKYMASYEATQLYEKLMSEVPARLSRAQRNGTSEHNYTASEAVDTPWRTERCAVCEAFHHSFVKSGGQLCGHCGNPYDDDDHKPPCEDT